MHFEFLVEDQSGKNMLEFLIPMIISTSDTYRIHHYKGIGRIPKDIKQTNSTDAQKRILLNSLKRLLTGLGNTDFGGPMAVIVVCDLDDKCLVQFRSELDGILRSCSSKPTTRFCIAVEEGEAWLLGDINAIQSAYPNAKITILNSYQNDSICGTWELLADAIYPGGAEKLTGKGWQMIGAMKSEWALKISPQMNISENDSPSFNYFLRQLQGLASNNS